MNVLKILNLDENKSLILRNYLVCPKQHVVTLCALVLRVCLGMYLSHRKHCTVFSEVYVWIPHFKEIQCCRIKTTTNVLETLNSDKEKSRIVRNYLVFPKGHVLSLWALVLPVCLSMYLPQSMHCTIFSRKNLCEYHILRKYMVAE